MRRFLAILVIAAVAFAAKAHDFTDEVLTYDVQYKWGLITKVAGHVRIELASTPTHYRSVLTAASAPWADGIFKVRDTLSTEIIRASFRPVFYAKYAHEGSRYNRDEVRYTYSGNNVTGNCRRDSWKNDEFTGTQERVLEAEGQTVDMLAAFYYMRTIPYEQHQPGWSESLNIFSGKKKETLTIKYNGVERVRYKKRDYNCFHITFKFTSDDGHKSSDDMDAWITTNSARIPVKLEGELPVGKVRCFYTGDAGL